MKRSRWTLGRIPISTQCLVKMANPSRFTRWELMGSPVGTAMRRTSGAACPLTPRWTQSLMAEAAAYQSCASAGGFTLLEMLAVIALIALAAGIVAPRG